MVLCAGGRKVRAGRQGKSGATWKVFECAGGQAGDVGTRDECVRDDHTVGWRATAL